MSNQFHINSNYTLDKYVVATNIAGIRNYWTGSVWSATFADGQQYSLSPDTLDGIAGYAGSIDTAISTALDIDILCWEDGATVALGTQVEALQVPWTGTDIGSTGTLTFVVSAGSTDVSAAVQSDLSMKLWQHRDYPVSDIRCPAWTLSNFTASTIDAVTLQMYQTVSGGGYSTDLPVALFSGGASQSGADTVLAVPMTSSGTGALAASTINLPTYVYSLSVTVSGDTLQVADGDVRVRAANIVIG